MAENKIPYTTNEQEIEVLKKVFAEEDTLLLSVRALMFGLPITTGEATVIRSIFGDSKVKEAFRRKLYAILSRDSLLGQGGDFWFGTDSEVIGQTPETIRQVILSKQKCLEMFEQGMKILSNPTDKPVDLSVNLDLSLAGDPYAIGLLARNKYIHAVNTALAMIKAVSGLKKESVAETKQRLFKNESK